MRRDWHSKPNDCYLWAAIIFKLTSRKLTHFIVLHSDQFRSPQAPQWPARHETLRSRDWTNPQREWLKRIAAQTKANVIVDLYAIDDPDLIFKREGGGSARVEALGSSPLKSPPKGNPWQLTFLGYSVAVWFNGDFLASSFGIH